MLLKIKLPLLSLVDEYFVLPLGLSQIRFTKIFGNKESLHKLYTEPLNDVVITLSFLSFFIVYTFLTIGNKKTIGLSENIFKYFP